MYLYMQLRYICYKAILCELYHIHHIGEVINANLLVLGDEGITDLIKECKSLRSCLTPTSEQELTTFMSQCYAFTAGLF